ncbi:MAG: Calx-beta domain-containing protein [Verrucomicrobiota bacterium]
MRHCVVPSALVASLVATPLLCAGQTLLLDTNFPAGDGPGSYVRSIAVQEDGRLLVAGSFTNFNGALTPPLVRLQPDGALDTNFAAGPLIAENGLGPSVTRAVPLSDGRILIEGSFTHVSGLGRTNVALLRAGGAVDATFALPEILPRNALYGSIYPSQRAGFWVTGTFTNIGSISQLRLAKVDAAGAVDASFHSPLRTTGEIIWSLVPLPDDELLVSGQLLDGTGTAVASVVRLRPDGSVDPSFAAELPANTTRINRLALLPGGDIVAEATSASANALMDGAHSLVRWTPDGRKVATFKPDFSFQRSISDVYSRILGLWPQPDGKLIVAGTFAEVNGIQRIGLARLLADGTTDLCFDPGIGPESYVLASATQADGSILIGGAFRSFEGQSQPYLARLRSTSDCGAGAISFASDTFRVNEGSPSALIAVVRNGPVDRAETVQLSTGTGSATAGEDYLASRVNLTFAPGERVLTWSIALRPDVQLEGDESVSLHLASGGPGVQIQAPAVATLTIVDQTNYWGAGQVDTNFVVRLDAPVLAGCRSAGGGWFLAVTPTNNVGYATFDSVLRHVRTDGSIDPAFAGTNRFNGVVRTLAELPDRTILVGGEFAQVNDLVAPGLARLFPDGSVDQSYAPLARLGVTAFGTHAMVSDLLVQTDGSVVCLGSLRPDEHGSFRSGQVLVRPDGTLDPAFGRGADDGYLTPSVLVSLPDGSRLSGLAGSAVTVGRYFPKGGRDPLFLPPAYLPVAVEALAVNPDGTVLVGGSTSFGLSLFSSGLALLAPNGADMAPFRENASHSFDVQSSVFSRLLLQPDGRMLLAGPIVRGNQSASVTVIRLNPDGSWDPSFDPTTGATPRPLTLESAGAEAPAEIRYLDQLPDGAILVGGDFASFGGLPQPFLVRLQPETARPPALHLTHPAVTVLETAQNLRFEVVRSGDASKQASVFVRAVGQTAVAGVDFVPLLEQVQFAPGEWFKPVSLEVRDNTLAQANRTLELRLEEPSAGQTLAEPQRTVVTIEDDDVNVEFGTDAISVIENEVCHRPDSAHRGRGWSARGASNRRRSHRIQDGSIPGQVRARNPHQLRSVADSGRRRR